MIRSARRIISCRMQQGRSARRAGIRIDCFTSTLSSPHFFSYHRASYARHRISSICRAPAWPRRFRAAACFRGAELTRRQDAQALSCARRRAFMGTFSPLLCWLFHARHARPPSFSPDISRLLGILATFSLRGAIAAGFLSQGQPPPPTSSH